MLNHDPHVLDFGGDAADETIAATSIIHGVSLITRDRIIRRSRTIPLAAWRETAVRPET